MPEFSLIVFLFLFNSLEIFGFHYACKFERDPRNKVWEDSKEILWFVKFYSEKWLGEKWSKPVCNCVICMASLHSLIIWIPIYIYLPFSFMLIYSHIIYVTALAGFNRIIAGLKALEL